MGTGPKADTGYDLALTEILDGEHRLLVEVGSERGAEVLARPAAPRRRPGRPRGRGAPRSTGAADRMGRSVDTTDIRDLLARNLEQRRAGTRSRSAASPAATARMVCPTCFCSSVEDVTDLTGEHAERTRSWDSCFSVDHSYIHGGSIRPSGRSRYRQWLTHKFGTWYDQFGSSGLRRLRALHHVVPGRDRRDRGADRDPRRAREPNDGDD